MANKKKEYYKLGPMTEGTLAEIAYNIFAQLNRKSLGVEFSLQTQNTQEGLPWERLYCIFRGLAPAKFEHS